ncbi:MAG: dicarboxylate/amino acid:cation symporter [Erysipelotrichia bacterium]|nr:dicarboxylate/amino acid:cation symporter [Erysipelotrichia bacterium]
MKKKISFLTIIALLLAIVSGLVFKEQVTAVDFIGTIYINLLKFMIGPIVFTSIAETIYDSSKKRGKLIIKSVIIFTLMFLATFFLTSIIVVLINPAKGFAFDLSSYEGALGNLSIKEIIINLFPTNVISMFQTNQLFAIILFAYLVGFCATKVEKGDVVIDVIKSFKNILFKILEYIMYLTPLAVFSLMSNTVAKYGSIVFAVGVKYILTAYLAGFITMIVVMILPVWIFAKMNPIFFVKRIYKIWIITITTCSSAATLPTTMRLCKEELNIDREITDIVVPLGCTIHMCGGAVSFALLGLFCSSLFGIEVTLTTYIIMIVASLLINMSAPGIPNGGVVIGATYLQLLGIPLDFIGFYSGIYKILDMLYTTLNVSGDITANVIIDYLEKKEK